MKIQLITERKNIDSDRITVSTFNKPMTFDSFDINIIDLSCAQIWYNNENNLLQCNYINDFKSLNRIIKSSKNLVVIILPQNNSYKYYCTRYISENYNYKYSKQLKDMLPEYINIVGEIINLNQFGKLLYENSETQINGKAFPSAFVFERTNTLCEKLAKSTGSNKATVISEDNIIITTLDICNSTDQLIDFIKGIGLYNDDKEPIPEWLKDYEILDDAKQKKLIADKKAQIEEAENSIETAENRLKENENYKSILYENGDSLVEHVYKILQEVLNKDMSNFIDEKKEDFNVSFDNVTFIGEIKGVTSNVKSEHISQLDVHCQGYKDKLQEENKEENVKGLLVINPLRSKPLEEREPIHEIQIALAKRNESLIIETKILLELFERFRRGEIDTKKIIEVFSLKTGLLKMEAFK
ncbi:MAG: hypothetical protein VZR54_02745 [Ruminococcus sp.]|nr:hypothetical protein [Ruminococcus sp.]